jgi:Poly(hydroxyalcanoate) granule associated protein (phasin)
MATKTATFPNLGRVQDSIRDLQIEGEKLFARGLDEATKLIGKDQRKALDAFLGRAKAIRKDIEKRTEKALKRLKSRTDKLLSQLDSQAKKGVEPIVRRLSLPTKHDVERLAKRLSSLEKKVDELLEARHPHLG